MSFDLYIAGIDEIPINDYESLAERLSEHRIKKAMKYKNEKDKRLSIIAGILIDRALIKYGLSEKNMQYSANEFGKPYFSNAEKLHFSISHSGNYSMIVMSNEEIGCDIQQITEIKSSIADRFFCNDEIRYIKSTADFFRIWALKESFIKAVGKGLAMSLNSFCIKGLDSEEPYCEYNGNLYRFKEPYKIKGYVIAVCEKTKVIDC